MGGPKPQVLITTPTLSFVEPKLTDSYDVVRYWQLPADTQLVGIRALTCLGNEKLTPIIERLPDLQMVACFTTGYDGIDLNLCKARGISVTHAPGASAHAVAEYALAMTLALLRNIVVGSRIVLAGQWVAGDPLIGKSLNEARVGIVGLGDIGTTFAKFAEVFGAKISWWGPRPKPNVRWPRTETLLELVRDSEIVVVCARAEASNVHLLSADLLSAMSANAVLINVARGQLVDEEALINCLRDGRIAGAALDVFETEPTPASRWADVPNVIVTPHIGGATWHTAEKMMAMMRENLDSFFQGQPLTNPVPEAES